MAGASREFRAGRGTGQARPDGGDLTRAGKPPDAASKLAGYLTGQQPPRPHVAHLESVPGVGEEAIWKGYRSRPAAGRLGIACSGGGIRSASYNLGALQEVRKAGLLRPADQGGATYLSAVSGGSYIAVAHAITAGMTHDRSLFSEHLPPWGPGSPEERHLRTHSNYLAPDLNGKTWFVTSVLYGLACNILPLLALLWLAATVVGWLYAVGLQPGIAESRVVVDAERLAWPAVPVAAGFGLFAFRRVLDRQREPSGRLLAFCKVWSPRLVLLGAAVAIVTLLLPTLLAAGVAATGWLRDALGADRLPVAPVLALGQLAGLGAVLVAIYRSTRGLGQRLLPLVARFVGPLLVAVPFLYWSKQAAVEGFQGRDSLASPWLLAAVVAIGVIAVTGHNVRWSMHPLYKEQLSSAFVLRRRRAGDGVEAVEPPYELPVLFSELDLPEGDSPARMPELIVCAALNISDPVVPPGRRAESFTFTAEESGSPWLDSYVDTRFYEAGAGVTRITLPAMMAISGAAVSPAMGKLTLPSVRLLLALLNVRLGVWLPNPLAAKRLRHERRQRMPGIRGALWRGWKQPGLLYVLYEALGLNNLDRDFVYISDGGHWENLGLVELLRRGCTEIICFDAAGDRLDSFDTIGSAIALARSELRVDIRLGGLAPLRYDDATHTSERDHVVTDFSYPDGTTGTLVFAKAAMPADAPWDLHAYRRRDPRFPCHSTGDQLFDDVQFEAYRALGAHAGRGVAATLLASREPTLSAGQPEADPDSNPLDR